MPRTWNIGAGDRSPFSQPAYPVDDGAGDSSEGGEVASNPVQRHDNLVDKPHVGGTPGDNSN